MSENQRIEFGHLPVEERIKSFRDFTIPLNDDEVHAQSLRCLHCGTPFCSNNCPLHNRPVDWNRLVREGDWERAWACLSATNSFPEFTSRVCPAICEAGCTRYLLDDAAVGIRSIERAVIDRARHEELGGLVLIDRDVCIGCGACAVACPYEAPKLDRKAGKMRKCDMCVDRLARKELPVCVAACPQRALDFGTVEELRKRHGDDGMIAPLAAGDYTKPNLLITKCAQAQPAPERTRSWPDFLNDKTA
jgi:glutamate synthase (NADH) small subunit